jgi:hypothetical protein
MWISVVVAGQGTDALLKVGLRHTCYITPPQLFQTQAHMPSAAGAQVSSDRVCQHRRQMSICLWFAHTELCCAEVGRRLL